MNIGVDLPLSSTSPALPLQPAATIQESTSAAVTVAKRPRGRPRKVSIQQLVTASELAEGVIVAVGIGDEGPVATTTKRGRGRPKKVATTGKVTDESGLDSKV